MLFLLELKDCIFGEIAFIGVVLACESFKLKILFEPDINILIKLVCFD